MANVPEQGEEGRFKKEWALLFEDSRVFVMFDPDDEGVKAGRRLAAALNGVVFDEWPAGVDDANSWFRVDREGMAASVGRFRRRVVGS